MMKNASEWKTLSLNRLQEITSVPPTSQIRFNDALIQERKIPSQVLEAIQHSSF